MINIRTGETVPVSWPSQAGIMVYRGGSGKIYGAAIDQTDTTLRTSIIELNISNQSLSRSIVEYLGEDTLFQAAETEASLASTLGGDGASLYNSFGMIHFERTTGLPSGLTGGGIYFITVDKEGSISWHDSTTGALKAIFKLYKNEWILEKADGFTVSGTISR
jgi:hypothetical protein